MFNHASRAAVIVFLLTALSCSDAKIPLAQGSLKPSLAGHVLVVNYWAKWCKPCREEIPELNILAKQFKQLQVLGVDFDNHQGLELQELIKSMGIEFPVLSGNYWLANIHPKLKTRPKVLPTTYLLIFQKDQLKPIIKPLIGQQSVATIVGQLEREGLSLR